MCVTRILWADYVWNPTAGCTQILPGCVNCEAKRKAPRIANRWGYPHNDCFKATTFVERIKIPLFWKQPKKILVNSRGDFFHKDIPDRIIKAVFAVMKQCKRHHFIIITKRPERVVSFLATNEQYKQMPNVWIGIAELTDNRLSPYIKQIDVSGKFIKMPVFN